MGGSEIYVQNLSRELVKLGFDVEWIGMRLSPDLKKEEINDDGVKIRRIDVPFNERRLFCFHPDLLKTIDDADVVQWQTFVAGITGGIISRIKNKPNILLCHEMFTDLWKKFTDNKFEQIVYPFLEKIIIRNRYDCAIVPCEYTKRTLIKLGMNENKIKVIPHGINHKLFTPVFGSYLEKYNLWDRFIIAWSGRMGFFGTSYSKNLKCLFDAFKKVKTKIPSAVLIMAGTGFESVEHYLECSDLEVGKDVIYVGKIPNEDMPSFYSSANIFVSSSLSEGFGFSVVEAQACGLPVVCFDAGSLPEVVSNGKTGIVIEKQTSSALAEGIIEMYKFPVMRNQMSNNAIKWVKQYDWKKTAKEYKKIYEDLYCWNKINR